MKKLTAEEKLSKIQHEMMVIHAKYDDFREKTYVPGVEDNPAYEEAYSHLKTVMGHVGFEMAQCEFLLSIMQKLATKQ